MNEEEYYKERFKNHEQKFKEHDEIFKEHDGRIDKLEQGQAEFRVEIRNLCKSLSSLTSAIKWAITFSIATLGGFFIYALQSHLFK